MKNGLKNNELGAFKKMLQEIENVVNDDNKATINGRTYQLSAMTHKQRLPFLQYYQDIQPQLNGVAKKSMDFETVEDMLKNIVLFDGALMKNIPTHFDKYPQDYMAYINTMLMVVVYPFLQEQLQALNGL